MASLPSLPSIPATTGNESAPAAPGSCWMREAWTGSSRPSSETSLTSCQAEDARLCSALCDAQSTRKKGNNGFAQDAVFSSSNFETAPTLQQHRKRMFQMNDDRIFTLCPPHGCQMVESATCKRPPSINALHSLMRFQTATATATATVR